jgi:hypothetical protein
MRVSFKYSQEDLVDATVRFAARSKAIRDIRRRGLFWSVVLLASVAIVIFKISIAGMIVAVVAVLVVVIMNPYLYDHRYRKNLRKIYKEKLGDEDEFICEVELLPEGLQTSGTNFHSTTEWDAIEDIVPTSDSVDIFGRKGGGCIVRNRAFGSPDERQRFIELAREYMNKARGLRATEE